MSEIRIAIGTEPRVEIARKVLEYSILKKTKSPVKFRYLMGEDYYDRGGNGEGTGFSLLRFFVPEMFSYHGGAIYLDADMLVLADIKELWDLLEDPEPVVWCKYGNEAKDEAETSVMVLNCEKARGRIKSLAETREYLKDDSNLKKYREIMKLKYLDPRPAELDRYWNIMDKRDLKSSVKDFHSKKAKLLHYTSVPNQPWFNPKHPAADIWGLWLKKAVKDGYLEKAELIEANKKFDFSNPRRPNGLHKHWVK